MVIPRYRPHSHERGLASIDLFLAMAIFLVGFFSVAYVSKREQRLARAYYFDAVAMALVDGELEVLAAGAWRTLPEGESKFATTAKSFTNLPAGEFRASRTAQVIRLEWLPTGKGNGRRIVREFNPAGQLRNPVP